MKPPITMRVIDEHGGFTALTKSGSAWNTLWRPGSILKKSHIGTLVTYREKSHFQNNNDVTVATYKVPGYNYKVVLWFDNKTGKRLA